MRYVRLRRDQNGSTSVEFALAAPLYAFMLFGLVHIGFWFWASAALQHGAELAARCASVDKTTCSSASAIAAYAARYSLGLPVSAAAFTSAQGSCGNQVSATYSYMNFMTRFGLSAPSIRASACFPL